MSDDSNAERSCTCCDIPCPLEALARIDALEAQLAAAREALRGCKLHLEDSQSGFIPGSISDQTWEAKRDDLIAEAETALGRATQ